MKKQARQFQNVAMWLAMALLLATLCGCGDQDEIYPPNAVYRVTVANLTYNQYFSPVAAIIHTKGYQAWEAGQPASEEMERLAEGGELQPGITSTTGKWLLTEAAKSYAVALVRVTLDAYSGQYVGILGGGRAQVNLSVPPGLDYRLTVATGLMFANDAFTGVTDLPVGQLNIGQSLTIYAPAYDAGTEANTETEMTVPGFADFETDVDGNFTQIKGFGYDPVRDYNLWGDDANDEITPHAGVITADEPLGDPPDPDKMEIRDNSALNESHRFLQPVAKIIVERLS